MAEFALALLLAYGIAAAFYFFRACAAPLRSVVLLATVSAILLAPLLVPRSLALLRLFVALNATGLAIKIWTYHVDANRAERLTLPAYLAYLPNWFILVTSRLPERPVPRRREEAARFAVSLAQLLGGIAYLKIAFSIRWGAAPFLIEHAVKVTGMYLAVVPLSRMGEALWRFGGFPALPFFDAPHRATTPAGFWRRWNLPAQQFLYQCVFKPFGGLRHPIRGVFLTFGLSALVHEYVFGIPLGRVQGFQTLFFMTQACGVALTLRFKPKGRAAVLGNALTLLFLLLTSVFFFRSVNAVAPFYDRGRARSNPLF
jgi:hypothetical protein